MEEIVVFGDDPEVISEDVQTDVLILDSDTIVIVDVVETEIVTVPVPEMAIVDGQVAEVIVDTTIETVVVFDEGGPQGTPGSAGGQGQQGIQGIPGTQGIQGEPGLPGSAPQAYIHSQGIPTDIWVVVHNLGYRPGGVVVQDSAGTVVEGSIAYDGANQITLTFSAPFAGSAYLS